MKGSRAVLVAAACLAAALYFGMSSTAHAGYGSSTAYQVEISSNPPGQGLWFWSALDSNGLGGDYQETDCIHLPKLGLVGAAHDSGEVSHWDTNGGMLNIYGGGVIDFTETVEISIPLPAGGYGHASSILVTPLSGPPLIAGWYPAQVQLAP
jgi:hypothetical protein